MKHEFTTRCANKDCDNGQVKNPDSMPEFYKPLRDLGYSVYKAMLAVSDSPKALILWKLPEKAADTPQSAWDAIVAAYNAVATVYLKIAPTLKCADCDGTGTIEHSYKMTRKEAKALIDEHVGGGNYTGDGQWLEWGYWAKGEGDKKPFLIGNWNNFENGHRHKVEFNLDDTKLIRAVEWLRIEQEWCDAVESCSECGKCVQCQPNSYGWLPGYSTAIDGTLMCCECIRKNREDILEAMTNDANLAFTGKVLDAVGGESWIEKQGFKRYEKQFESGFHRGQDDDPKVVSRKLRKLGLDHVFVIDSKGQFDVDWSVFIKASDEAMKLLNISGYQGYSTAEEFSKALRGEHSDYVYSETKLVTQERFVSGKY